MKIRVFDKDLIILPSLNKRILKRVSKILKVNVTKTVCISDELRLKVDFMNFLNTQNLKVLDGRWLFKYLSLETLEFICEKSGMTLETEEISILVNENNNFIFENIMRMSQNVKNINIITKNVKQFKKLEDIIYKENGLIIRVTNDLKKAALKSRILLNFDFNENEFNKVNFLKNAIIVNFENNINNLKKNFEGKIINFYHINLPKKYEKGFEKFNRFNSSILYESFIFKNTLPKNIWKEIENDKIKIDSLEGKNGFVRFSNLEKPKKSVK